MTQQQLPLVTAFGASHENIILLINGETTYWQWVVTYDEHTGSIMVYHGRGTDITIYNLDKEHRDDLFMEERNGSDVIELRWSTPGEPDAVGTSVYNSNAQPELDLLLDTYMNVWHPTYDYQDDPANPGETIRTLVPSTLTRAEKFNKMVDDTSRNYPSIVSGYDEEDEPSSWAEICSSRVVKNIFKVYREVCHPTEEKTFDEFLDELKLKVRPSDNESSVAVPIGGMIPFWGMKYGVPMPDNYVVCDGSKITDHRAHPSLYGKNTLNMNEVSIVGTQSLIPTGAINGVNSINLTKAHLPTNQYNIETGGPWDSGSEKTTIALSPSFSGNSVSGLKAYGETTNDSVLPTNWLAPIMRADLSSHWEAGSGISGNTHYYPRSLESSKRSTSNTKHSHDVEVTLPTISCSGSVSIDDIDFDHTHKASFKLNNASQVKLDLRGKFVEVPYIMRIW